MSVASGVAPAPLGVTLAVVPTTQPRYTVTDTGELREMLDAAARRWPEVTDRRKLLLKLAETGAERVASEQESAEARRARQVEAAQRIREWVDVDVLLSNEAWR